MDIDPNVLGNVPGNILEVLLLLEGHVHLPDEDEWEAEQPYENLRRGKCMTCGNVLGAGTVMMVNSEGILGLWDRPECLADIHAISFLREVEGAIVQRIEDRGEDAE